MAYSGTQLFLYDADGVETASGITLMSYTGARQWPAMAGLTSGGFVAAWEGEEQDGDNGGIYVMRAYPDGSAWY